MEALENYDINMDQPQAAVGLEFLKLGGAKNEIRISNEKKKKKNKFLKFVLLANCRSTSS